jgi:hypothetical protein
MANRSYLCVSDVETLYPNIGDPNYDSTVQTVACDVYCVPLLWLALFRPADMLSQVFEVDGEQVTGTAPLAPKAIALGQLARAIPTLNRLFAAEGPLDEYADLLRTAVADAPGQFVTIEMEEIADLWTPSPQAFYRQFSLALGRFESSRSRAADRKRLVCISKLRPGIPFPPARCFLEGIEVSSDDCWNHCRLIGASWYRPVPW